MLQLVFSAIALAAADLAHAEALLVVVDRLVTTAQVAAIVAQWKCSLAVEELWHQLEWCMNLSFVSYNAVKDEKMCDC